MKTTSPSLTPLDRLTKIAISHFLFENVISLFPTSGEDSSTPHQKVTVTYKETK